MNTRDRWDSSDADWSGFASDLDISDEDFVAAIERGRESERSGRPQVTARHN